MNQIIKNIRAYKKIGFDLDGTIINSLDGIYESYLFAVTKLGLEVLPKDFIKTKIGPPIETFFTNLYPLNTDLMSEYSAIYRKYYLDEGYKKTTLKEGFVKFLDLLNNNSHKLFILTNRSSDASQLILEILEIEQYFETVVSVDPLDKKLFNKRNHLTEIFKDDPLGIYVGDTMEDYNACIGSKVIFIGLSDGFGVFSDEIKQTSNIYGSVLELLSIY